MGPRDADSRVTSVGLWDSVSQTIRELGSDASYGAWKVVWAKARRKRGGERAGSTQNTALMKAVYALYHLGRFDLTRLGHANRAFLNWPVKMIQSELSPEGAGVVVALELLQESPKIGHDAFLEQVKVRLREKLGKSAQIGRECVEAAFELFHGEKIRKQPWKARPQFILSFGFLHSYHRTLGVVAVFCCLQVWLMWLAGLLNIHFFLRWLLDLGLAVIVILMGIWAVRLTVAGYDYLFDAFDEDVTLQKLLYRPLGRKRNDPLPSERRTDARGAIENLFFEAKNPFSSESGYERFREGIRVILYSPRWVKSEYPWILVGFGCFVVYVVLFTLFGGSTVWSFYGVMVVPWTPLMALIGVPITALWFVFGFSELRLIYGYLDALRLLGSSRKDLRIWKYINHLRKQPTHDLADMRTADKESIFMTYPEFYLDATRIGRQVFYVALALIATMVAGLLRQVVFVEWMGFGQINWTTWLLAIIVIPGSVLLFLYPQARLHIILQDAQTALLQCWKKDYGIRSRRFVALFQATRFKPPSQQTESELGVLRANLETLRTLIQDTRTESTWAFGRGMAFGATTLSLVPTAAAILQTVIFR